MRIQTALTNGWRIKQVEKSKLDEALLTREVASSDDSWLTTRMPAQVHDVLFEHGLISDPRVSKNAADSAWVGEKDWAYACTFDSPERTNGSVMLHFGGLDTLASVYLNGSYLGEFDNMFRESSVEVVNRLAPPGQENVLLIVFSSPLAFIREVDQPQEHFRIVETYKLTSRTLGYVGDTPEQQHRLSKAGIEDHHYLRKSHGDFDSYLGARPHSVKVGIYRDIVLDVPGRAWIEDLCVRSELTENLTRALISTRIETSGVEASLDWTLTDPSGQEVARGSTNTSSDSFAIELEDPKLWWPYTHGVPHLYQLRVNLTSGGEVLDSRSINVGIRDVRAVLADLEIGEERFKFEINGQSIYLRGACWAPLDGMTHCWDRDRAIKLIDLAEHGRMNLLRIWGGGHVPPVEFYDECDRRGILVWQDFMFGFGMYPSGTPAFDDNCRMEVEGLIRQLRNHPSILLWCGGNESHMGWDFQIGGEPTVGRELFEKIMPEVCASLDPTRFYHPNSPYGGRDPNSPLEGDRHDYSGVSFFNGDSVPVFVSEFGRVSAPSLASMRRFLDEEELWPEGHDPTIRTPGQAAWPPMWEYRASDAAWDWVGALEGYCEPATVGDLVRVLGTSHGEECIQRFVERYRRGVPDGSPARSRRCWGNMVWRLNDSWPELSWSVVDYYLEPKIPFYFLRRAYAPVLVCFEQTADKLAVWIVNDSPETVAGELKVRRLRFDGTLEGEVKAAVTIEPAQSKRCLDTVDLGPISLREDLLHATFGDTEATYLLKSERYLHLPRAEVRARCVDGKIEVSTDLFARQITLEVESVTGAVWEDNFFDMIPGQTRTIALINAAGGREVSVRALNADQVKVHLQGE